MSKQPNSLSKPRFSLSQTRSSKSKSSKSNKLSFSLSLKRLRLPHYRLRSSFVGQSLSRKLHRFSSRPISSALKHPYLNQMSLSNKEKLISIKKDKRLIKERLIKIKKFELLTKAETFFFAHVCDKDLLEIAD